MTAFAAFCTDYFKKYFALHPTEAIYYGIEGYDHLLNDYSDETYRAEKTFVEESLNTLNRSEFGLQAGVFTRDFKRITRAFETLEVGGLMIGEVPTFRIDHMPYGGAKDSGLGREGLRYAIEEMTEPRLLAINPAGL